MSKEEKYKNEIIDLNEPVVDSEIIDLTETAVDDSVIIELRAPVVDRNIIELTEIVDINSQSADDVEIHGFNINDINTDYDFDSEVKSTESDFNRVDISDDLSDFEISREFEVMDSDPFGDSELSGDFSTDDIDSFFDSEPEIKSEPKGFSVPRLSGLPDLTKARSEKSVELSGDFSMDEIDSMFDSNNIAEESVSEDLSGDFSVDDIDSLFDNLPDEKEESKGFDVPRLSGLPDLTKPRESKPDISGSFSMDEIDSMFDGNNIKEEAPKEEVSGDFSVDDIDALFDSMSNDKEEPKGFDVPRLSGLPDLTKPRESKADISGSFSMDEIDSMFDGNNDVAGSDNKEDLSGTFSLDEIDSMFDGNNNTEASDTKEDFSVDDIDAMFDSKPEQKEDLSGSFSVDDIDAMFDGDKTEAPLEEESVPDLSESLIADDDIEALLNGGLESKEESTKFDIPKLSGLPDLTKPRESKPDLSGSFSLDEIDSMFDGNDITDEAPKEDVSGDFSVDDIDALFDSMSNDKEESKGFDIPRLSGLPDLTKPRESKADLSGAFSMDEIDSMFDGNNDLAGSDNKEDLTGDFSLDDIDAMFDNKPEQKEDLSGSFSVDDIDAMFDGDKTEAPLEEESVPDLSESLIADDDLESILNGGFESKEESTTKFDIPKLSGLPDLTKPRETKSGSFSMDEIDSMFDADFDIPEPEGDEFSPDDIDALLESEMAKIDSEPSNFNIKPLSGLPDLTKPGVRKPAESEGLNLADGFSNDDIDALFNNAGNKPEERSDFQIKKLSGLPDLTKPAKAKQTEAFSADDIDSLFDNDEITLPEPEDDFSPNDIDALLESEMARLDNGPADFNIQKLSGLPDLTKPRETKAKDEIALTDGFSNDDIDSLFDMMNADEPFENNFNIKKLSGLPDLTKSRESISSDDIDVLFDNEETIILPETQNGYSTDDIDALLEKEMNSLDIEEDMPSGFNIGKLSGLPDLTKPRAKKDEAILSDGFSSDDIEALFEKEDENAFKLTDGGEGFKIGKLSGLPDLTKSGKGKPKTDNGFAPGELESFFGDEDPKSEGFNIKKLSGLPDLTRRREEDPFLSMDEIDSMLSDVQDGKYDDLLTESVDDEESFVPMDDYDLNDIMLDKLDIDGDLSEINDRVAEKTAAGFDFDGKVNVSKEQIEEAVQSIVKGMYSKKIELMLLDAIEETVKKEIENFKNKVKE